MSALRHLWRDREGSAAVEFGIVIPAFLLMLLGVFQVGIWMQSYNAMRNAVTETARSVSVEYQTDNQLTNTQIENTGLSVATRVPYMLERGRTTVDVVQPLVQPFSDARMVNMELTYTMPSFLGFAGIPGPTVSYSRSMYLALD